MINFVILTLATYALTFLVVSSAVLTPVRKWLVEHTKFLIVANSHPLMCRMCFSVWAAIIVCLIAGEYSIIKILGICGSSYFLATQERR